MQNVELYYLIDKQLGELLMKASKILTGKPSDAEIADFHKHSAGVKRFLAHYVAHAGVQNVLKQVPDIEYRSAGVMAGIFEWPVLSALLNPGRVTRKGAIEGVKTARDVYATIFYLHQSEAA